LTEIEKSFTIQLIEKRFIPFQPYVNREVFLRQSNAVDWCDDLLTAPKGESPRYQAGKKEAV
jgi:hypothetical protein